MQTLQNKEILKCHVEGHTAQLAEIHTPGLSTTADQLKMCVDTTCHLVSLP